MRLFTLITLAYLVMQKSTVLRRVTTFHTARRTTTTTAMRIAFHNSVCSGYR
jgi:ectoine hydroxylase-related dioxygenase (phytanoyl-CoA dioxygenase family)